MHPCQWLREGPLLRLLKAIPAAGKCSEVENVVPVLYLYYGFEKGSQIGLVKRHAFESHLQWRPSLRCSSSPFKCAKLAGIGLGP
jgi:hypothetical protein